MNELVIKHIPEESRFETKEDGYTAYLTYCETDDSLDVTHTIVPKPIEGRGIAGNLVKAAYDYALSKGLTPKGSCSYAAVWLIRHPAYKK